MALVAVSVDPRGDTPRDRERHDRKRPPIRKPRHDPGRAVDERPLDNEAGRGAPGEGERPLATA